MAINPLAMTNEDLIQQYLNDPRYATLNYTANTGYGRPVDEGGYTGYDAYGINDLGLNVDRIYSGMEGNGLGGDAYMETPTYSGYKSQLTTPDQDGKYLLATYDDAGNLVDVTEETRDTGGWFGENIDWLAPMLIGGMAFAGAGGLGTLGSTAAADAGLGFATGNELAGLAAAEAGFGGSAAGLTGLEAGLVGGSLADTVAFDAFGNPTTSLDTLTSAAESTGGNFWDAPYMDAFETTPYPGSSWVTPWAPGDTGVDLVSGLKNMGSGILNTLGVSNGSLFSAGANILGNYLGNRELSSGIKDAARINQQTTDKILALQQPWITAGTGAVNRLATGLAPGGEFATPFTQTDWQQDPGYQFRLSEGLKALDRQMASRGSLLSGGALKGSQRYAQDLASQEYQNAFNRYYNERTNMLAPIQSLAGLGQTNVGQASNALTAGGTNAGNAALTGGALQASQYGSLGNLIGKMFA